MKLAIMQPYFLPYVGYWQLIHAVDLFVLFDDVNFKKKGYINRNSILANGNPYRITLELLGASQNKLINQIEVGANKLKILKTIEQCYKKAPFFEDVFPVLRSIFESDEKNLSSFIGNSIKAISHHLDLKTEFIYSSEIKKNNDFKGQDRILNIAGLLGAVQYINAIGGQGLYDKEYFAENDIQLNFLSTITVEYKQFDAPFQPNLSIIDIMMFNDVGEVRKIFSSYELK